MVNKICPICKHEMKNYDKESYIPVDYLFIESHSHKTLPTTLKKIKLCRRCGELISYITGATITPKSSSLIESRNLMSVHIKKFFNVQTEYDILNCATKLFENIENETLKKSIYEFTCLNNQIENEKFYLNENLQNALEPINEAYNKAVKCIQKEWDNLYEKYPDFEKHLITVKPIAPKEMNTFNFDEVTQTAYYAYNIRWMSKSNNLIFFGNTGLPKDYNIENSTKAIKEKILICKNHKIANSVISKEISYYEKFKNYSLTIETIPISDIVFFKEIGNIDKEYNISGGGGTGGGVNIGGAYAGGLLFGTVGAIVGSQIGTETKIDPIETTISKEDHRKVLFQYNKNENVKTLELPYQFMNYFMCLIPEKEYSAVVVNNACQSNNNANTNLDKFEEIKKYKELLDMGIITQKEFNEKKKQLL